MPTTLQKLTPQHRLTKVLMVTYTIIEILMLCGILKKGFMSPSYWVLVQTLLCFPSGFLSFVFGYIDSWHYLIYLASVYINFLLIDALIRRITR